MIDACALRENIGVACHWYIWHHWLHLAQWAWDCIGLGVELRHARKELAHIEIVENASTKKKAVDQPLVR